MSLGETQNNNDVAIETSSETLGRGHRQAKPLKLYHWEISLHTVLVAHMTPYAPPSILKTDPQIPHFTL